MTSLKFSIVDALENFCSSEGAVLDAIAKLQEFAEKSPTKRYANCSVRIIF